jgi:cytochrome c oxidase subunit 2
MKILHNFLILCDIAEQWQTGIQDPATPALEGMLNFYNYLIIFCIIIGIVIFFFLYWIIIHFNKDLNENIKPVQFTHSNVLEIVWTIIPAFILVLIAIPSFSLLYSLDELAHPRMTIKVIGHQWYWSYEYSNIFENHFNNPLNEEAELLAMLGEIYFPKFVGKFPVSFKINFDSYMKNTDDLLIGDFRLLDVDNTLVLPTRFHIRVLVTSADVLHSWAVPSFGIKVDACPGRLSQASLLLKREGLFYGQCSEICGVNHGFMPIVVRTVTPKLFVGWVCNNLE